MKSSSRLMISEEERRILKAVQDGLPICERPYLVKAQELCIAEGELIERLRKLLERGVIRRISASVAHRKLGFGANAMCVWKVPEDRVRAVGEKISRSPRITHCYARASVPGWDYNLYAMVHGKTREDCLDVIARLSAEVGIDDYLVLFSTCELKKTWSSI